MKNIAFCLLALVWAAQANAASGVIAGAIRWDAWYSAGGNAALAQKALGPQVYQSRAPKNCSPVSTYQITCPSSQATMDAEIAAAVSGGLKYWAFDQYAPSSDLTTGWNLYQSSAHKADINWCWISNLSVMGSTGNFSAVNAAFVAQFLQTNYQKVTVTTAGRPVFYILWDNTNFASAWGGSYTNVAAAITDLRTQAVAAGLGSPYIVVMSGQAASAATINTNIGGDAITAYNALAAATVNGTFASLSTQTQAFWVAQQGTGAQIVPIAMNGFFQTPRISHPESFLGAGAVPYLGVNNVYAIATNAELITHLAAAVTYINSNPAVVPSTLMLIYSWNECDEGGCILPTIGDPTGAKLAAIKATIN